MGVNSGARARRNTAAPSALAHGAPAFEHVRRHAQETRPAARMSGAPARCCLLAACGLPGAGKSTLCAALAAHVAATGGAACACVSFDALERSALAPDAAFDAARWKARRLFQLRQTAASRAR